jgi:RNA polymerase sigma factor (sigma-70 family)
MVESDNELMSDTVLVQKAIEGDAQAFEAIIDKYTKPIYNYLLRIMYFHIQDAEDALAETMFKAYSGLNSFNPELKFSSWLYRIAHNQAVDILKKKKHKLVELDDNLSNFTFTPNFGINQKEDLEKILQILKEDDRNLLTLFYLEEKTVTEIGQILKERPTTVSVKLHRAKARAQKQVQKKFKKSYAF